MRLTQEQLEAIRQRAENATSGPWDVHPSLGVCNDCGNLYEVVESQMFFSPVVAELKREEDARFIAHARTDIPALLDHIAELEAELAYMNGVVGTLLSSLSLIEEQVEGNTLLLVQEAIKYAKEAES
jgi:hypothetical protein